MTQVARERSRQMDASPRLVDRSVTKLAQAVARRCRAPALVVQQRDLGLTTALAERGVTLQEIEADHLGSGAEEPTTFRTVVITETLEYVAEDAADEVLARAWLLVEPGGRLIVTVPNEGCASGTAQVRAFTRRRLRKVLQRLGQPRLATDQPYRWLMMYVEKPRAGGRPPPRTRRDRYRATARLCRGRVLELGSGEGHLARTIRDRGHEVVAVDLSVRKIETARASYPEIEFLRCDILELDLPDASFDTVVLAEVLEHVDAEHGEAMLAQAWRLLRPRGRLIVSVPNEDCIPHRNHVREFDRRSLARLLRRWGRPRLVTEQPFQWLMMYVDKRD